MCSFGESVQMTPMQLGAIVAAIANGGSLFYLQHPTTPEQIAAFQPRLKRTLNIKAAVPEMLPGMAGAVNSNYGTARRLRVNFGDFPVLGKTGTCSKQRHALRLVCGVWGRPLRPHCHGVLPYGWAADVRAQGRGADGNLLSCSLKPRLLRREARRAGGACQHQRHGYQWGLRRAGAVPVASEAADKRSSSRAPNILHCASLVGAPRLNAFAGRRDVVPARSTHT